MLNILLDIINQIITDIECLSSPQLNTALASVIYKMKNKSIYHHKSFRLVRILPLCGRIFDEYLRPVFCSITKPLQNQNQYGFTSGISYLMAALQRHEAEQFCIDIKKHFLQLHLMGKMHSKLCQELYRPENFIVLQNNVVIIG